MTSHVSLDSPISSVPSFSRFSFPYLRSSQTTIYLLFTSIAFLLVITIQSSTTNDVQSSLSQHVSKTAFSTLPLFNVLTDSRWFHLTSCLSLIFLSWPVPIRSTCICICIYIHPYYFPRVCINIDNSLPIRSHPSMLLLSAPFGASVTISSSRYPHFHVPSLLSLIHIAVLCRILFCTKNIIFLILTIILVLNILPILISNNPGISPLSQATTEISQ